MKLKTLEDINIKGKTVLLRVDYNVPLKKGKIIDDFKIKGSLKTVKDLIKNKCKIIILSHLGRPQEVQEKLRMRPIAQRLSKLLGKNVQYAKEYIGPVIKTKIQKLKPGEILVLENVRFNQGEEFNDKNFAKKLAELCDIYVNDAFAVCHREHASVVGITQYKPSFAGFLIEKEVIELSKLLNPKKPFVVLIGGVKLSTKLNLIKDLLNKADKILIGGAMAFTFLKADNQEVGKSLVEENFVEEAKKLLKNKKIILPIDFLIAPDKNSKKGELAVKIPKNLIGLDIGKKSTELFINELKKAKTIFWNGPLGYVENKIFAKSTITIAKELAKMKNKVRIVGGGDTVKIIDKLDLRKKYTYVSTGGGASMQFLTKKLPGLTVLEKKKKI